MINLGLSLFARNRHVKGSGYSYTNLSEDVLIGLVKENWHLRQPGMGETDVSRKVVVPLPSDVAYLFYCTTVLLKDCMNVSASILPISARVLKRQENEDPFVQNFIPAWQAERLGIQPEKAGSVKIVCYSAEALLENEGERSTDCDWEIVTMIVSPIENEPMTPLSMARNQLEKPGGTKSHYTPEQWAEAVYYWSQRVRILE